MSHRRIAPPERQPPWSEVTNATAPAHRERLLPSDRALLNACLVGNYRAYNC